VGSTGTSVKAVLLVLAAACWCQLLAPAAAAQPAGEISRVFHRFSLGYHGVDTAGNFVRATEYSKPKDSLVGGLGAHYFSLNQHLYLDADYLNDSDYNGEFHFDYKGLIRFHAMGESLYHNLEHIPYPTQSIPNPVTVTPPLTVSDKNPGDQYHMEVRQASVQARGKLPAFPAHLNLSYWRLEREGSKQLRFLDESCGGCHLQSRSRRVDRVTEEFTGSVDAHLGPVDLIFEQLVRLFRDREPVPVDTFERHDFRTESPALLEHDADPDSRLLATTIKAHTSLAGGFNAAAGFTIGTRSNQSDLAGVAPVEAKTDFTKTVGDVTYTLNPHLTLSFRYRLLDLNSSNSNVQLLNDVLTDPAAFTLPSIPVRASIDLTRAWYATTATWRPSRGTTIKADFRREDLDRSGTGPPGDPSVWVLPEQETRNHYRLSAFIHPRSVKGLKLKTWYQYRTADDPAYATTIARGHEGFASLTWAPHQTWGVNLHGRAAMGENRKHTVVQLTTNGTGQYQLDRTSKNESLGAGFWANPSPGVGLSLNYGYSRTRIEQDLLFGQEPFNNLTIENEDVDYSQDIQTLTLAANWRITDALTTLVEGHCSQSEGRYSPNFSPRNLDFRVEPGDPSLIFPVDSTQLAALSAFDFVKSGFVAGLEWKPFPNWTCSARYRYDDYDDRITGLFEGSVQSLTIATGIAW
jgi:hypothetical protein